MPMAALFDCCSELAGVIKEKKAALPPADAEGNRPKTALDGEIAALEAVSATAAWQCCCLGRYSVGSAHSDAAENMACHFVQHMNSNAARLVSFCCMGLVWIVPPRGRAARVPSSNRMAVHCVANQTVFCPAAGAQGADWQEAERAALQLGQPAAGPGCDHLRRRRLQHLPAHR